MVDRATGEEVTVLTQPTITSPSGAVLNDIHGIAVRVASDQDTLPEQATVTTACFSATGRVVDPAEFGVHCKSPASA